ncbi:MAG: PilZ domain-containing protein [Myxococcota bacterium]
MSDSAQEPLAQAPCWSRTIVYHASRDALGPKTDVILSRLGYQMLLPETFEATRAEHPDLEAELLVVDERRLDEAEAYQNEGAGPPIVLLTGRQGATGDDPQIVGAVKRPAGLHDLYKLMQQVFEDVPRSTPRVATQLRAHCASGDTEWEGRVLSLSENGCLIRSPEAILLGQKVRLELVLPRRESIALEAEATYQLLPDTGLVWSAIDAGSREALGRFVTQTILA